MENKEELASSAEVAKLFGMSVKRVQQLAKEGVITPAKQRPYRFDLLATATEYILYLREQIQGKERRTSRTPYLREPMESFTDPKVRRIVMVAASQVGKSEMEMNFIGYIIDQDPGNTILQKSFPGGMLTITESNSASALASTPARYIIGDERDRWAVSAGTEGDPWALAKARQATFYNAKAVEVSTPTVKGASNIKDSFYQGTQERWRHQCPECEEYSEITFDKIKFEHHVSKVRGKDMKARRIHQTSLWQFYTG